MIKFFTSIALLLFPFFGTCQTTDFIVVSSASTNNNSAFTVGEIFVAGQSTSGFLASHLVNSVKVSIQEIENSHLNKKLTVFPNPTNDFINFEAASEVLHNKRLMIYASNGELVLDQLLDGNTFSLASLNAGLYNIRIEGFEDVRIALLK